jgi:hypothetical protein
MNNPNNFIWYDGAPVFSCGPKRLVILCEHGSDRKWCMRPHSENANAMGEKIQTAIERCWSRIIYRLDQEPGDLPEWRMKIRKVLKSPTMEDVIIARAMTFFNLEAIGA